jgi:predicted  nucleic acid-binding Zn-ribbon protein
MPDDSGKNTDKLNYLRQAAEEKLSDTETDLSILKKFKKEDVKSLLREIQILRTELDIQTDELNRVQKELTGVYSNIVNFYENAPLGYISVNVDGIIKTVNNFVVSS